MSELENRIREAAEMWPDKIGYNTETGGCAYLLSDDGDRCIVGEAFHLLGIDDDTLSELTGTAMNAVAELESWGHEIVWDRPIWIRAVQNMQDIGFRWADAVRFVDDHIDKIEATVEAWEKCEYEDRQFEDFEAIMRDVAKAFAGNYGYELTAGLGYGHLGKWEKREG